MPLNRGIRESADGGRPTGVADPDGEIARAYKAIARRAAAKLALRKKYFSAKFPNIVIQQN